MHYIALYTDGNGLVRAFEFEADCLEHVVPHARAAVRCALDEFRRSHPSYRIRSTWFKLGAIHERDTGKIVYPGVDYSTNN